MHGDFSRTTFDPRKHYSGVLAQQGRVSLDADEGEQVAIGQHLLRSLARDLIGPHGGPGDGFTIAEADPFDFAILPGHYYVEGILCENEGQDDAGPGQQGAAPTAVAPVTYNTQPDRPPGVDPLQANKTYLVYLDVWERFVTYVEDDSIREVALRGPDTAARSRVVWQVRIFDVAGHEPQSENDPDGLLRELRPPLSAARLMAQAKPDPSSEDPCVVPSTSRYRGVENQLYRVEIHAPGTGEQATFKWSSDNGSVVFPILPPVANPVRLENLGRDDRSTLARNDFVEAVDLDVITEGRANPLGEVLEVDPDEETVTLPSGFVPGVSATRHPLLRRWHRDVEGLDLKDGAIKVREGDWIDLEDGVQVWFEAGGTYRTGDFWLIPARTEIGDVLWPRGQVSDPSQPPPPLLRPPAGVLHHYAPLCKLSVGADGKISVGTVFRRTIEPAAKQP
jgi:hypothetical protein